MTRIFLISHPNEEPKYGRPAPNVGTKMVIPWNTTLTHRRKFIKRHGQYLENKTVLKKGELYFWGEYEPQSTCTIQRKIISPKAVHDSLCPVRNTTVPPDALNTDPYVFGEHFKNICCGIGRRNYKLGDVLLFGKIEFKNGTFIMNLDTVLVIKEKVKINHLLNTTQYYKASIEPLRNSKKDFFYRGKNYATDQNYFSYVPCLLDYPYVPLNNPFPELDLNSLGFKVNKSRFGYTAAAIPFTSELWDDIMNSVTNQGWLIGTHIDKI